MQNTKNREHDTWVEKEEMEVEEGRQKTAASGSQPTTKLQTSLTLIALASRALLWLQ